MCESTLKFSFKMSDMIFGGFAIRYGAYPDGKNWYISGGTFPSPPPPPARAKASKVSAPAPPKQYRKYLHQDANGQ